MKRYLYIIFLIGLINDISEIPAPIMNRIMSMDKKYVPKNINRVLKSHKQVFLHKARSDLKRKKR